MEIMIIQSIHDKMPSVIVEYVWHVHTEFFKHYRRFCMRFFRRTLYPEDYAVDFNRIELQKLDYENTLKAYQEITNWVPDPDYWESVELKFQSRVDILRDIIDQTDK